MISMFSLDTEDSQTHCNRPCYLDPWIVNLLLEYDESGTGEDGQLGHVLKVLNEGRALHHDEQHPAAVLCIADGHHYIQVDVTTKAVQMSKGSLPQPGFSSIVGQFIVLQNYRVCFKEAAKVEDCQFYLVLDCFRVMPMKRQKMRMQDCNREPSVLEKIKELWQKSFALQPWSSSEPSSVSDVLREIKQDRLSTLKQNAKDCLTLSNPSKLLDSEQLAVYPDTKWQVERKHDKMHQDTFTIPAKLLVISAENEALLCKSYPQRLSRSVPESAQDDDRSTISFFSAESESLDGSLENPWDIFPGMTLSTSSGTSSTPHSFPPPQHVFLAHTAEEEEIPCSNSCTPDLLEPHAHMSHCSSGQGEPIEMVSSSLLSLHNNTSLKKSVNRESSTVALNTAHHVSKNPDTDETISCGQPLRNSHSQTSMCLLSPVYPPVRRDPSLGPLSENMEVNMEEDHLAHLQRDKVVVREAGEKFLDKDMKCVSAKRKQKVPDEEETFSDPGCTSLKALGQHSAVAFLESSKLEKVAMSKPKKSRIEELQVQQHLVSAQGKKGKEQGATVVILRRPEEQLGVQQRECVAGAPFHITYPPPTSELCSQVRSTRISRALLEWARWVFSSTQKQ
ncbi:uncharacterized protein LOC133369312 isoform X2 [Rhineura floridana]|uniref:uncharacterized protein LOC133369312 isoform X2 n=1 Tax=Rhineura floridana TaxID=261503 RepID=UPI002AC7ED0C|nr:uncharacterized protein LOC133369312 isoform X2 [Rhineura floridana]XP_061450465.1 uncharacterized protein LOC133369312 isoform X2 [Rhineura floridana]XP_061450467.1 uncharacterized protein LOC133369312 isoform X2 [Rhineura floridana]XP_061450468.1 uncharacterized protein LOC133369312 isoform X2 [Rhineura floridana]